MEKQESTNKRNLTGVPRTIRDVIVALLPILIILYVLGVHSKIGLTIFAEQVFGAFMGLGLTASYLSVSASSKLSNTKIPWYDWLLAALSFAAGLYIVVKFPEINFNFGNITPDRVLFATLCVFLVIEALRRWTGWVIVIVIAVFFAYSAVAPYMPGPLLGLSITYKDLINYIYLDTGGMLSMVSIAARLIMAFIIFGQVLLTFGGAEMLNDFVVALMGAFRGGAAKAAVIGSALTGTMSGSPVTNVVLTGTITIPLMKRSGYTAVEAGAIESTASTGGMIMPPVMGSAAFIMADYLGIAYLDVCKAAIIPALLYYISLFMQIEIIAVRDGVKGIPASERMPLSKAIKQGWIVFVVIGLLVYLLAGARLAAAQAAIYSAFLSIPLFLIKKNARDNFFGKLKDFFVKSGKTVLALIAIMSGAGIIVGIVGATGLAFSLTYALVQIGQGSLFLLILLAAGVCIILGMGMPAAAAYVLMAALVAPAITTLGVPALAAHLFIFYFAIMSNITPPVCSACFVASPIAGAPVMKIGYNSMAFGAVAFVVPFIFVYSPQLIMVGTVPDILLSFATAIIGVLFMSAAIRGFLVRKLEILPRLLYLACGIAVILPIRFGSFGDIYTIMNLTGLGVALALTLFQYALRKRENQRGGMNEPTAIS